MHLTAEQFEQLQAHLEETHLDDIVDASDERSKRSTVTAFRASVLRTLTGWFTCNSIPLPAAPLLSRFAADWVADTYLACKSVRKELAAGPRL